MEKNVNIVEILKNKSNGTKLYSPLFGDVYFSFIDGEFITVKHHEKIANFYRNGRFYDYEGAESLLFPSKEMRDWSKLAWNTGDILVNKDGNAHVIFEGFDDDTYETFNGNNYLWKNEGITMCFGEYEDELPTSDFSKANKEDAQKYIHQIEKRLGYKLNFETLKIEKTQPEFKIGDILFVKYNNRNIIFILSNINGKFYNHRVRLDSNKVIINYSDSHFQNEGIEFIRYATEEEKQQLFDALAKKGKAWDAENKMVVDLKPKCEFKPMDLCLMKYIGQYNNRGWELCQYAYTEHRVSSSGEQRDFYHAIGGKIYAECIPYKGNEHLLGTKKSK